MLAETATQRSSKLRIMVVDDDATLLALIGKTLQKLYPDARLHLMSDAPTALKLYEATHPHIDVVLLDMMIGDNDGLALGESILQINPIEQIILMSAYSTGAVVRRSGAEAVAYVLEKSQLELLQEHGGGLLDYYIRKACAAKRRALDHRRLAQQAREIEAGSALSAYLTQDLRDSLDGLHQQIERLAAGSNGSPALDPLRPHVARARAALHDLLALGWLRDREPGLEAKRFTDLARDALDRVGPLLARRHPRIEVQPSLLEVRCNVPALTQMVFHLVQIAAHLVPPGSRPEIAIWVHERDGRVRLNVAGNGLALHAGDEELLSTLFGSLHGVEADPALGLAMALVRRGLERLGGSTGIEPGAERGTILWMELPRAGS